MEYYWVRDWREGFATLSNCCATCTLARCAIGATPAHAALADLAVLAHWTTLFTLCLFLHLFRIFSFFDHPARFLSLAQFWSLRPRTNQQRLRAWKSARNALHLSHVDHPRQVLQERRRAIAFEFRNGAAADPTVAAYCRAVHVFRPGGDPRIMEAFDQQP
jgi:hypothetical protein